MAARKEVMRVIRQLSWALVATLAACSGESSDTVPLPSFAAELPGQTAICVQMRRPLGEDLLAALKANFEGELKQPSPDVFAFLGDSKVGWKTLADSRKFAEAWQLVDSQSAALVYVDLEQLVDSQLKVMNQRIASMGRFVDLLFLEGFRFGVFNLDDKAGDLQIDGLVRTSGTRAGLPGVLGTKAGGGFLGGASEDDLFALDGRLKANVVRQMIERAVTENTFTEALASGVLSALPAIVGKHWTGEISIRLRAGGDLRLALGILDRDGLEALVTRLPFVREMSGDLLALPGGLIARVTESVVFIGREAFDVPKAVKAELGLWVRGQSGGGFSGSLIREGDDLKVSLRLPKSR